METSINVTQVAGDVLLEFLEVAIHSILYTRQLYPAGAFHRTSKYNVPVQMCSHSGVKLYVQELLGSILYLLSSGRVPQLAVVILSKQRTPLERFVFELAPPTRGVHPLSDDTFLLKLEQGLRAFLLKLNTCDALLTAIPTECSWTVQLHTTDSASVEMQQQQTTEDFTWLPADKREVEMNDTQLTPLKSMTSTVLKMQLFVEECNKKCQQ